MDSPGAGPVSAMAAAQKSLALTLSEELKAAGQKVYELILPPINMRARLGLTDPDWYSAEGVGDYISNILKVEDKRVMHRLINS